MTTPKNIGPEHHAVDEFSGTRTTGHEWDGIRELDTPLPRWWLYIFYACIAVAVVYWVLMPAWPMLNSYTPGTLGFSDRRNVAAEIQTLQAARKPSFERLNTATYDQIVADPQLAEFARAAGESTFGDNCRTCHGAGGAGAPGYPNLADDVWIWGGTLTDIEHTLRVGVRSTHADTRLSVMPAYGRDQLLSAREIGDVAEYVLTLSAARDRAKPDAAAAARGAAVFQQQCVACHGATGAGDRAFGAPSLTDDVWLYGGSREEVRKQIELGRGGVMPTWEARFDPAMIRALSVYVYGLGGGEPTPVAAPAAAPAPAAATTP
ncbi:MAG: cytochrome-c oxidase, cbb3-type subunit III [Hyphomonadaceae bacterium]|nr:MAG: cytochrome c oxidase cbb3-type subunit III [Caulobacteraceae bacterium]MBT9446983.1 cytochrome-c oxidase, cbb3-type subunit III [Hyphomonadaceae bacterium]